MFFLKGSHSKTAEYHCGGTWCASSSDKCAVCAASPNTPFYCATTRSCVQSLDYCPCPAATPIRCRGETPKCVASATDCPNPCTICPYNKNLCVPNDNYPAGCCSQGVFCERLGTCVANHLQDCFCPTCNDRIGCTEDICYANYTCKNVPKNNLCASNTQGCSIATCNPTIGCVKNSSSISCQDEFECSVDSCNLLGNCEHTLVKSNEGCICTSLQSNCISATKTVVAYEKQVQAGFNLVIQIYPKNSKGDDISIPINLLSVSIGSGSSTGYEPLQPSTQGNNPSVSWLPKKVGTYYMRILIGGFPISGSPISFVVYPGPVSERSTQFIGSGAFYAVAGTPNSFKIQMKDQYGNNLESSQLPVKVKFHGNHEIPVTVENNNNGTYIASYTAGFADRYVLEVSYNKTSVGISHLGNSPYNFTVVAASNNKTDPGRSVVQALKSVRAGTPLNFTVLARDNQGNPRNVGGDKFDVALSRSTESNTALPNIEFADRNNGRYEGYFVATIAGVYSLSVTISGVHIAGSPFTITVTTSFISPQSSIVNLPEGGKAGVAFSFGIKLRDIYGNVIVSNYNREVLKVSIAYLQTSIPHFKEHEVISLQDSSSGTINAKVLLIPSGYFRVTVRINNENVTGSPFNWYQSHADAPKVVKAAFNDVPTKVSIGFSDATNRANYGANSFNCTNIISLQNSVVKLGPGATCVFISESTLLLTLGNRATLQPGDAIEILPRKIYSRFNNSESITGNITVTSPIQPVPPSAVITLSSKVIGACQSLGVSAALSSGDGGRELDYYWLIEPGNEDLDAITVANSPELKIPPSAFTDGVTYTITLTIQNFLTLVSTTSVKVTKAATPVPYVFINTKPTFTVKFAESFKIPAVAQFPTCHNETFAKTLGFQWIPTPFVQGLALRERDLFIPAKKLTPGQTYWFTLVASVLSNPSITNNATVSVTVDRSAPLARIWGRSTNFPLDEVLELRSGSIDVENPQNPLTYSWKCSDITFSTPQPCVNSSDGTELTFPTTANITLPAETLGLGTFVFTLAVTSIQGLSDDTSVTITVIQGNPPKVSIDPLPTGTKKINPSEKISLIGRAASRIDSATLTYLWSCSDFKFSHETIATPVTSTNLVIRPNVLPGGIQITFRLTVTDQFGNSNYADITLHTNSLPTPGTIQVSNYTGIAYVTPFEIEATGWTDDDNYLEYAFYYTVDNGERIPLGTSSTNNKLPPTVFPHGTIHAFVVVTDRDKGLVRKRLDTPIIVQQFVPQDVKEFAEDYVNNVIETSRANGDSSETARGVAAVASLLNEENSTLNPEEKRGIVESLVDALTSTLKNDTVVTPDDLVLKITTLSEVVKGNDDSIAKKGVDFVTDLVERTTSLDADSVKVVVKTISDILDTTTVNHGEVGEKVTETIDKLLDASVDRLTCGEEALVAESDQIKMVAQVISDMLNPTIASGATHFSFPNFTKQFENCLKVKSVTSKSDLGAGSRKRSFSGERRSAVLSLEVSGDNGIINQDFGGVDITFDIDTPLTAGKEYQCVYREGVSDDWKKDDTCVVVTFTDTQVTCHCTHMTDFAVVEVSSDTTGSSTNDYSISSGVVIKPTLAVFLATVMLFLSKLV